MVESTIHVSKLEPDTEDSTAESTAASQLNASENKLGLLDELYASIEAFKRKMQEMNRGMAENLGALLGVE